MMGHIRVHERLAFLHYYNYNKEKKHPIYPVRAIRHIAITLSRRVASTSPALPKKVIKKA